MKRRVMFLVLSWVLLISSMASAKVGFIWSDFNAESYQWNRQEEALELLDMYGIEYEKITDEEGRDVEHLNKYKVITAVNTYKLPNGVAEALAKYVKRGGKLVWADGPVGVTYPEFSRVFGFTDGYQKCYYMKDAQFFPKEGNELELEEVTIASGAANAYLSEVIDTARVWATMSGPMSLPRSSEREEITINAIVVNQYGEGLGILINWHIFATGDLSMKLLYPEMVLWAEEG